MPAESNARGGQPLEPDPGNTGGGKRTRYGPETVARSKAARPAFRDGRPFSLAGRMERENYHEGAVIWRRDEMAVTETGTGRVRSGRAGAAITAFRPRRKSICAGLSFRTCACR